MAFQAMGPIGILPMEHLGNAQGVDSINRHQEHGFPIRSNLTNRVMKKLAIIPFLALIGCAVAQSPVEDFKNKPVPAFKFTDTTGKAITPASMKGKVYLIDFWATWCGPCKAAMPTMQRLHNKYKGKGFTVIGANILENGGDKPSVAGKFKAAAKLTYVFAKDTPDTEKFANKLQIQGIPTFLLIDKKGVIREVQVGFSPTHEADLAKKIEALLR